MCWVKVGEDEGFDMSCEYSSEDYATVRPKVHLYRTLVYMVQATPSLPNPAVHYPKLLYKPKPPKWISTPSPP